MIYQIPNIKLPFNHNQEALKQWVCQSLNLEDHQVGQLNIIKKSVDARKKPNIFFVYTIAVDIQGNINGKLFKKFQITPYQKKHYVLPKFTQVRDVEQLNHIEEEKRPVIIGFGPAGLFAAYVLALKGMKPTVYERGEDVDARMKSIEHFNLTGELNLNSNIQFGEGGAGTYSDGKLNTGVKDKFNRKSFILNTFVEHGGDPSLIYVNKPHVGTDYLTRIVKSMRQKIIDLGGEIHFNTLVTDMSFHQGRIESVTIEHKGERRVQSCRQVILAIGHSARDTFRRLYELKVPMTSKPFALGLRIEHPQSFIQYSQYGPVKDPDHSLPVADYKLTYQSSNGRGVYSFCMCPGGYVVNSSSHENMAVCNGMSHFARDHFNANSAIIATVTPEDYESDSPLAGVEFQEKWERKAFELGGGQYKLPTQTYGEFYESVFNRPYQYELPKESIYHIEDVATTCESPTTYGELTQCLPEGVAQSICEGIESFGRRIKGFNHPKARLIGVETRTSSPVRIPRDESFMSELQGLYPCGEGAGYAGGIMSAAIDGMKVAEVIVENYTD
jgi:uncharacterized FAD-dependent dehydrogenase